MATSDENENRCPDCDRLIDSPKGFSLGKFSTKFRLQCQLCHGNEKKPVSLNSKPSPLEVKVTFPRVRPKKRAVLIGVTYKNWKYKLKGTINDVKTMKNLLMEKFSYRQENIVILTEDEPPELRPTKKNIQKSMQWLVEGCKSGDSLVFFYSGHGLREPENKGDELDKFDETICPVDFLEEGMIYDNEINSTIVWPLTKGVTLHAIVDACHSGTVLDLLYVYNNQKRRWEDNTPPSGARKYTKGGLAICISACADSEEAADTSAFTGKANGALTYVLVDTIYKYPGLTYGDLLDYINEAFRKANEDASFFARILRKVFKYKLSQIPILSASEPIGLYKRQFTL